MRTLLSVLLLAATAAAQSTVAHVDDPVSPGTLGDGLLSLDEAIRVVNGTLSLSSLSAAERARITGTGVPTGIEIDAAVTPTITLTRTPTPLDGPAAGVDVSLRGVGGRPVLDATGRTQALGIHTSHATVQRLAIRGGRDGVVADAAVHFQTGRQILLDDLEFSGQSGSAVKLSAAGVMGMTPVMIQHTAFRNLATALEIDDLSQGGAVMTDLEHVSFDGVQLGVDLFSGATGSMTMCRLWRCEMTNSDQLARVRRGPTNDQRIMLMVVAGEFETNGDSVDALGTSVVETAIHVHHSVFRPAAGRKAFVMGPQDARIDFHVSENVIHGDIDVAEGRLNRRLWAWNNVFRDGTFAVSNQGAPTSFRWNRFENCTIRALPTNSGRFGHSSSEFHGCTIDGQSFTGEVHLENCWLGGTTVMGNVTQSSPAPSRWLATTSASTGKPALGGQVDLTLDLPPGMLGVWQLGVSNPRLVLTQEPWREYAFQHGPTLLLPGIYALHTTLRVPVPNDANLVGQQIYCEPITGPYLGQTHVPLLNFPRGAHLDIVR